MRLLYIISLSLAMGILTGDSLATKRIVPGTYSTIRSAVDAAVDGDTILVQSNAVYDPVDITKDLTIMAASGYKPALRQIANDAVYDYGLQVWRHDDNSTTTLRCIGMTFNGAAVSSGINTSPLGIRYGCVVILDGCTVNPASTNKAAVEGRCYQLTVENSTIGRGVNGRAIEWANLTQPVSTRYDYDPESHDCGETETELTLADSFICGSCNAVALGSVDVTRCTFDGSNDVSVALYFTDVTGSIAVTNSAFMNFTSRVISPGQCPSTFTHNLTWSIGSGEACSVSGTTNLLGVDPLFCDEHEDTVKKYSLRIDSPCVAGNNEWNEGIGHNDGVECAWGTLARNTTVPTKTFVRVLEDVLVPSGKTLTVAPGAELRFDGGDNSGGGSDASKNELIVEGALSASGTSTDPIKFITANTTPTGSDWRGIRLKSGTATISQAQVSDADYGIDISTDGSVSVSNTSFSNNSITDLQTASGAVASIDNNTVAVGAGTGFKIVDAGSVAGNTLNGDANSTAGISLPTAGGSSLTLANNTVSGLTNGKAVEIAAGSPILTKNKLKE